MDHSLEAHVDLSATNDLGDIGGVVGLKESNLEALILEVTLGLSEVQGGMVRRSVPLQVSKILNRVRPCNCYQLVRKVILSVDILIKYHGAIASLRPVSITSTESLFRVTGKEIRESSHACPFAGIIQIKL